VAGPTDYFSAGATALQAFSALLGAGAQKKQSAEERAIAKANAKSAVATAAANESQVRRQASQIMGAQRVAYAAAGVRNEGTTLDVAADSSAQAELDALMQRYSGAVEAANYKNQGAAARRSGTNAGISGGIGVGNSILSGLTAWQRHKDQLDLLNEGVD
jgi:hypothetical protein